ncbi:YjcZ family sporulation protein [Paenibacillus sp. PL2-23]
MGNVGAGYGYNSVGAILVLFILLVIIAKTICSY